ncbi:MAG: Na+/H+ antiporter subunit E [Bauldia sp.]|uniref:Na+/H+ antiporter subunit E n=1 Tax=Bauldia sp. TaxID=2575872 RepID=UPI001DCAC9D0|nr:Na+/H+ antiporter subunit E [Bauldia sp.]MCB1495194.1 Na+/H+ antiporter subunit E [Bauldia sp.]
MRLVSLAISLFIFWVLLSGHFDAFLLGAGALTAILVAAAGRLFGYTDQEGHPAELILPGLLFWPWLVKEIVVSALGVSKIILSRSLPISPRLLTIWPTQKTAVGVVTFANSITLTPGTITVEAERDRNHIRYLTVHALTDETAAGLETGDMDRHVTTFEGRS